MPTYMESEIPTVVTNGGYSNGGLGNGWEGIIGLLVVASLFGNGFGGFGGRNAAALGGDFFGYQLGRTATSEDIASGFAMNTLQRGIDDIILGQAQMQNFVNQGFAGINTSLLQGFHGVDSAICTLGYQNQVGFAGLSRELADCCCKTQGAIADLKYANERQTCDILASQTAQTQRLIDYLTSEKIDALRAENTALKGKLSNASQTAEIVGALAPKQPIPAYPVFPTTSFAYPSGVTFGVGNNCGCGCGCSTI